MSYWWCNIIIQFEAFQLLSFLAFVHNIPHLNFNYIISSSVVPLYACNLNEDVSCAFKQNIKIIINTVVSQVFLRAFGVVFH